MLVGVMHLATLYHGHEFFFVQVAVITEVVQLEKEAQLFFESAACTAA